MKPRKPKHPEPTQELSQEEQTRRVWLANNSSISQKDSLVKFILETCEHPMNWPLDDKERIAFLRECYQRAERIRKTQRMETRP